MKSAGRQKCLTAVEEEQIVSHLILHMSCCKIIKFENNLPGARSFVKLYGKQIRPYVKTFKHLDPKRTRFWQLKRQSKRCVKRAAIFCVPSTK